MTDGQTELVWLLQRSAAMRTRCETDLPFYRQLYPVLYEVHGVYGRHFKHLSSLVDISDASINRWYTTFAVSYVILWHQCILSGLHQSC